jgi:apolipoprotein N-acyltransferase
MVGSLKARSRRGAALGGLLAGGVAYAAVMAWIYPFLVRWGMLSRPEAAAVFLLLIFYMSLYVAAFCFVLRVWAGRWGTGPALLLAPAAWTALELGRGVLLTGFPWCLLGYSQAGVPAAIQVADLGGVYGVSFMLACTGAGAAALWPRGDAARWRRPAAPRAAFSLIAVAMAGLGYGALRLAGGEADGGPGVPVALVQANVEQTDKWDPRERDRIEADHVRMTREAVAGGARLVIWSESSVPASITTDRGYAKRLEDLARETQADLVVGTVTYETRGGRRVPFNSAYLVGPDGSWAHRYDKQHLVPFGEYVPLKGLLFFVESLVQEAGDFVPGTGGAPLPARGLPLGPLICYEAVFPELARARVRQGAQALVNITNDAWYGDTAMPRQHLAMAVLRAVESRRWLLRCANTGLSALVDTRGRVRGVTRLEEAALLRGEIPAVRGLTVYAAAGDVFAILCAILAAACLIAALARGAARTGPIETPPHGDRRSTQHHAS